MEWIIAIALAGGGAFWISRSKAAKRANKAKTTTAKSSPHRAVSIKIGRHACEPAKAQDGQRYLSAEAPTLPLPGCSSGSCQCAYVHHPDRRDVNAYRRIANTLSSQLRQNNGEDRRQNRGRRKTDR